MSTTKLKIQPAWAKASGSARIETPTRTLIELNSVCTAVDEAEGCLSYATLIVDPLDSGLSTSSIGLIDPNDVGLAAARAKGIASAGGDDDSGGERRCGVASPDIETASESIRGIDGRIACEAAVLRLRRCRARITAFGGNRSSSQS